jgi:hypothetical protein
MDTRDDHRERGARRVRVIPNDEDPDGLCFAIETDQHDRPVRLFVLSPQGEGHSVEAIIPYERPRPAQREE